MLLPPKRKFGKGFTLDSTEQLQADTIFHDFLVDMKLTPCKCGREIDRADVAWNNAETEAGTPHSSVTIQCVSCQEGIAWWHSWWPEIESFEELVERVLDDYHPS